MILKVRPRPEMTRGKGTKLSGASTEEKSQKTLTMRCSNRKSPARKHSGQTKASEEKGRSSAYQKRKQAIQASILKARAENARVSKDESLKQTTPSVQQSRKPSPHRDSPQTDSPNQTRKPAIQGSIRNAQKDSARDAKDDRLKQTTPSVQQSRNPSPQRDSPPSNKRSMMLRTSQQSPKTRSKSTRRGSFSSSVSVLGPTLKAMNIKKRKFPKNVPRTNRGLMGRRKVTTTDALANTDMMNILGSDGLVSTDFILDRLDEVQRHPGIVKLELEDFLGRSRDARIIAVALRHLMLCDDRPWESVRFVDDMRASNVATLKQWQVQKKLFLRNLGTVFQERLVPVQYQTKVSLPDTLGKVDSVALLKFMQKEKSITTLTFSAKESDPVVLQALVDLFQCDNRAWQDVTLNLSGKFYW
ncbi:expressed unknown protein [Seminavis robusta]|uniref:Uncharacterized protein n=1 Tax=Seminavis robusta TaxID=568900 RepID=A0A9N8HNY8_9STRA|nr:expressed unknown protein [Seminavis robusta]|eukprot:Sro1128_g244320.1 n/a (415) ;mRNA; r:32109-33353